MVDVNGFVSPGFEAVGDMFAANFDAGLELGSSFAMTVDGDSVIDIWAGDSDRAGAPWREDTIVNVFSVTKTMAAIPVLLLADRGEIDLAAPVAHYWPEFGANGKGAITVSQVMSHSSGLPAFDPPIPGVEFLYDWDACCARLAGQEPWWEPGTASGYHAITQGYLQGEIVRRVTGTSIGRFFRSEIAEPLGADFHMGLDEIHDGRVAELIPPQGSIADQAADQPADSIAARTYASSPLTGAEPGSRSWRAAEIPSIAGTGNARSIARIHAMIACGGELDGVRIMSEAGVTELFTEQIRGTDLVSGVPLVFGNGMALSSDLTPVSPNERAAFWAGWGGSFAVIDLDGRASVAYAMNKMADDQASDFRGALLAATALGSLTS